MAHSLKIAAGMVAALATLDGSVSRRLTGSESGVTLAAYVQLPEIPTEPVDMINIHSCLGNSEFYVWKAWIKKATGGATR